jgi:hypothetical protein
MEMKPLQKDCCWNTRPENALQEAGTASGVEADHEKVVAARSGREWHSLSIGYRSSVGPIDLFEHLLLNLIFHSQADNITS